LNKNVVAILVKLPELIKETCLKPQDETNFDFECTNNYYICSLTILVNEKGGLVFNFFT